jgi:hypothetical protein
MFENREGPNYSEGDPASPQYADRHPDRQNPLNLGQKQFPGYHTLAFSPGTADESPEAPVFKSPSDTTRQNDKNGYPVTATEGGSHLCGPPA